MKTAWIKRASTTVPGRVAVVFLAAVCGVLLYAPAASADGTWSYFVNPNPAAPGEDVSISVVIENCPFHTPVGGQVSVIITDPDNVQYGPFVVVPEDTWTNYFSYTFTIPAGGPAGTWVFAVVYTGKAVPTGCTAPGTEQNVEVVADADSPALAVVPAVGLVGVGGLYLASRRRRAEAGTSV
jgi:hypothetical protein